jgi:hypothetical protein
MMETSYHRCFRNVLFIKLIVCENYEPFQQKNDPEDSQSRAPAGCCGQCGVIPRENLAHLLTTEGIPSLYPSLKNRSRRRKVKAHMCESR